MASAYHSIKAALQVLDAPSEGGGVPPKQALLEAASRVRSDVTKVGVMFIDGSPTASEAAGLLDALPQSLIALCITAHRFTAGAGPTLLRVIREAVQQVVAPSLALVKALEEGHQVEAKHQVALVWQACDALPKTPLDNKAALFKKLGDAFAVVRDCLREIRELQEGGQQGEGDDPPAAGPGGGDAGGEADLDLEVGPLDAAEALVVGEAHKLVEAAEAALREVARVLLQGPPLQPGPMVEAWESILFHARHLQRSTEDLGAALYPPQEGEEVCSAAHAVCSGATMILDECPQLEALGEAGQQLQQRLELALTAVVGGFV